MDRTVPIENYLSVDLECGGTTSEEEGLKEPVSGSKQTNKVLGGVWSSFVSFDRSVQDEAAINTYNKLSDPAEVLVEAVPLLTDKQLRVEEKVSLVEKDIGKERPKKKKKPPKPPRPPKSPQLDAADHELVREIYELAMLKRARTERMKALKKMKAAKASSSSSSMCSMIITIFFCLVIILQGTLSRSVSNNFRGSLESTKAGGLILVQYNRNLSMSFGNGPSFGHPNMEEQVS